MSVTGGRRCWAWVGSVSIWVGLALVPTLACGGRTSTLEPGAFDPDQDPYAGNTSGGSSGTPAPTAGSSSVPSAGSSAGGSASSGPAATVCENYCGGYAQKCAVRLEGRECVSACLQEMTGFGTKCQNLGIAALKCLTPFFKRADPSCDVAVDQALTKCAKQVENFDDCKGIAGDPEPQPQPNPQPMPSPTPTPTPGSCGEMSTATIDYCYTAYACPEGVYSTTCKFLMTGAYDCFCSYPNGAAQGFTLGGNYPPCEYASEVCGFTPGVLK